MKLWSMSHFFFFNMKLKQRRREVLHDFMKLEMNIKCSFSLVLLSQGIAQYSKPNYEIISCDTTVHCLPYIRWHKARLTMPSHLRVCCVYVHSLSGGGGQVNLIPWNLRNYKNIIIQELKPKNGKLSQFEAWKLWQFQLKV